MKKSILLPIITIALAAAILLGLSFGLNGIAAQKSQADHLWLMQTLLPDSTEFTLESYAGEDANIRSVHKGEGGFVIETVSYGYAGNITVLVGVNNTRISGVEDYENLLYASEPGDQWTITIYRDYRQYTASVTLGEANT